MYKGRKPLLTDEQADQLRARRTTGGSVTALAREYGISRKTAYRYLEHLPEAAGGIGYSDN